METPWLTDEIKQERRIRNRFKRTWQKDKIEINRQLYRAQSCNVARMIHDSKLSFYREKIGSAGSKDLFKTIKDILGSGKTMLLPEHTDNQC
jgi:hypothetical protein